MAAIQAAGGSAFALQADLALPHAAEALWAAFDKHADGLDILVNNAGVVVYGRVNEISEDDFDRLFAVNVKAPLFIIQHGLRRLQDGGRIINVCRRQPPISPAQWRPSMRRPRGRSAP